MTNAKFIFFLSILVVEHIAEARVVDFSNDTNLLKHLQVHQCRQKCFTETLSGHTGNLMNFSTCRGIPDCYMCYDYCEVLPKAAIDLAHSMCSDTVYCSKGCRIACSHHRILDSNTLQYDIGHQ